MVEPTLDNHPSGGFECKDDKNLLIDSVGG